MDLGISGKTALVAAASKGLGRAIAHGLASEGARVAICARTEGVLAATAREINETTGTDVLPVVADVTTAAGCERFVAAAEDKWGGADILVTNSGGPTPGGFDTADDAAWQSAFESTLLNVVRLIRLCLPHMKQQRWGRIVNVQSVSVKQPIDGLLLSNSMRPGAIGLARTLATDLAPHGVLVNSVCPGSHDTERLREVGETRAAHNGTSVEHEMRQLAAAIPLGRLGRPDELANAAVFLCSERASFITGTSLVVDGGAYRGIM